MVRLKSYFDQKIELSLPLARQQDKLSRAVTFCLLILFIS